MSGITFEWCLEEVAWILEGRKQQVNTVGAGKAAFFGESSAFA